MEYVAEYVSPGHPDRICDNIVNRCVKRAISKVDTKALVGLECAVHTNNVFIDGRIACGYSANYKGYTEMLDSEIDEIIKNTYKDIGYNDIYYPSSDKLKIIKNVCIEHLSDDENDIRPYSDDQNVVCGFATNDKNTEYMNIEHYLSHFIGHNLWEWYKTENIKELGPDFKIMVHINENNDKYEWKRFTLSWEHSKQTSYKKLYPLLKNKIDEILKKFFDKVEANKEKYEKLKTLLDNQFLFNGAGDFIQGGPDGDNGLSGKKLVIDYYGPRVPIGGGAIFGKDPYKVDVCGSYKARAFAIDMLKVNNFENVYTKLAWSPGDDIPYMIEAYTTDKLGTIMKIDNNMYPSRDTFSIDCINKEYNLGERINDKLVDSAILNMGIVKN